MFLIDYNHTSIGPTDQEISWTLISWFSQLARTLRNCLYFSNNILTCRFLANWSVSQHLLNPVVGSSQLLCQKLRIFCLFFTLQKNYDRDAILNFGNLTCAVYKLLKVPCPNKITGRLFRINHYLIQLPIVQKSSNYISKLGTQTIGLSQITYHRHV